MHISQKYVCCYMRYFFEILNLRLLFSFILFSICNIAGQSLTGVTGLFTIPTTEIINEGKVSFGSFFLPKNFMNGTEGNRYNGLVIMGSVGFFQNLEMGLRITHILEKENNYLGDRMVFVKYRVINENSLLPGIALGVHDFMGPGGGIKAQHFNSLYIVSSKTINDILFLSSLQVTLGYGTDIIDAGGYQFIGLFGGASFNFSLLTSDFSLLLENDAIRWNGGIRITLFDHIKLLAGLMEFKHFTGGVSFNWKL